MLLHSADYLPSNRKRPLVLGTGPVVVVLAAAVVTTVAALVVTTVAALVLIDDHLFSAILRSLEQTHCARLWLYMSD